MLDVGSPKNAYVKLLVSGGALSILNCSFCFLFPFFIYTVIITVIIT